MASLPIFALEHVFFSYPAGQDVLREVNLEFYPGQRLGLYGANGSGKTTLFHLIVGLLAPTRGRVLFHGHEVRTEQEFQPVRRALGLVMQNAEDQLFCPTVLDDVAFGPLNLGLDPDAARKRALTTLAELGLDGFENRLTHRLSGGEKKLVSLATILSMRPKVLLLDEPTNGLDPATRTRLTKILRDLPTARMIISHDWNFLAQTTDKFLTTNEGRLVVETPLLLHQHGHAHPGGDQPHEHQD